MAKNQKIKKIHTFALLIFILIIVALTAYFVYTTACNYNNEIPFLFGFAYLQIKSQSMEDTIPKGEFIGVVPIAPEDVKVGDVIVYNARRDDIYGLLNTHRVIEILYDESGTLSGFRTKGDGNIFDDEYITLPGDIRGKYTGNLKTLTALDRYLKNGIVVFMLFLIPALSLGVVILKTMSLKSLQRSENKKEELLRAELEKLRKNGLPPEYNIEIANHKTESEMPCGTSDKDR